MDKSQLKDKLAWACKYILFPLLLLCFSFVKVNKGINLEDTTYSLGNYRFFREGTGVWFLLTYASNVVGYVMTLLPGGNTMLGMSVYSTFIIAAMAILAYRFFITKMPYYLAFISEIIAIGMCWAPRTILYHYLTYFFLLIGCIFLFRGLAGEKEKFLIFAGIVLGVNTFVRFPNNGLEVLLIIPLIYYGIISHKTGKEILRKAALCVAGYLLGFALLLLAMTVQYGNDSFSRLITGVLGISGSASDYTLGAMILSILDAYWHGFRWALYLIVCSLMGIPFFLLWKGKYIKARKLIYCVCIALLYFVLYKWGMFNFKYYQKESALQLGVIFLILSIGVGIWMLFTRQINYDWKLIGCMSLVVIFITPLGSNNYVWPVLNNLFIIAPVTVWIIYRFAKWGREYLDYSEKVPLFAFKAMLFSIVIIFGIQAFGVGVKYVFADGEDGQDVSYNVVSSGVLKGMETTKDKAEALDGLVRFIADSEDKYAGRKIVLYGNLPGLSYILDMPSAINTTWSDLDSNPVEDMAEAIEGVDASNIKSRPLVIVKSSLVNVPDNSIKLDLVNRLINDNEYGISYENDMFVVYE